MERCKLFRAEWADAHQYDKIEDAVEALGKLVYTKPSKK